MDYRKLLEYYLSSDEWECELIAFWDENRHLYDPNEGTSKSGCVFYCSEVYHQYEQKLARAGGSYFDLHLTDEQFKKYFRRNVTSQQRFAVLFALWWGLSDTQIQLIADNQQKELCWCWLNYFLCNPTDHSPTLTREEIKAFAYCGNYFSNT